MGQDDNGRQRSLPRGWTGWVKSAVLDVISLARLSIVAARGWAAESGSARVRLAGENDRLKAELGLLREEIRIKDARMARIAAKHRPHYPPVERMAILELRAARGWSLRQTAKRFFLTGATVASWMKRVDEEGAGALVQMPEPVNKFPDFVGHIVRKLKTLCPALGKKKIAQILARAGLHLGTTTVGRMLKQKPRRKAADDAPSESSGRTVTAKYPNHLWHVDLTAVSTSAGYWTSWLPFAVPQRWPYCWWLAVAIDHFSRRVMGYCVFKEDPTSEAIRAFLGRTCHKVGSIPKYIVCDQGKQFFCGAFKRWCRRKGIRPRFGAVGQHGSLAVIERVILTMKSEYLRKILVPYCRENLQHELELFCTWYNEYRPHTTLGGKTPNEVYRKLFPANRRPRFEPRPHWPRPSPCARPHALVKGVPGAKLELHVSHVGGRKELPIVTLRRAA